MSLTFALKGRQGDKGDAGVNGDKGDKGDKGDTGEQGVGEFTDRGNLASSDFSVGDLTINGAWNELDLSNIIPANTKLAILYVTVKETTGHKSIMFSTNGAASGHNIFNTRTLRTTSSFAFAVPIVPTADGKISYAIGTGTWTLFEIVVSSWCI